MALLQFQFYYSSRLIYIGQTLCFRFDVDSPAETLQTIIPRRSFHQGIVNLQGGVVIYRVLYSQITLDRFCFQNFFNGATKLLSRAP